MTTIAWDGKILAADRMLLARGRSYEIKKLFDLGSKGFLAGSGCPVALELARAWLAGEATEKPLLKEETVEAIWIHEGEAFLIWEELIPVKLDSCYWACGSGGSFALAAMHCGKNAKEAVEIAIRLDNSTGFGVDYIELPI